jgi:hypothetical protein
LRRQDVKSQDDVCKWKWISEEMRMMRLKLKMDVSEVEPDPYCHKPQLT